MSGYNFRLATKADTSAVQSFIRQHWDAPHPLIELPDFFDYYYQAEGDALRFALAEQDGQIVAAAGFVPASQSPQPDVWVSLWVAHPAARGSGLELMAELPALTHCRTLACNNIRPETRPFYDFLGYTTGRVGHFYRLAPRSRYALAQVANPHIPPAGGEATLELLQSPAALRASGFVPPQNANPYKDLWYIERRFFHFPRQAYQLYAARLPGDAAPCALLATRTVHTAGTAVLRLADYMGPPQFLPQLGAAINSLMADADAEYAEFYCAGIPADTLLAAGFTERAEDSPDIIPNYLSPPLIQNTEYYYFTSQPEGFTLFKADGDQDRPNTPL